MVRLTFYGGVEGEIGGNIILLEDEKADVKIFLDFGCNYKRRSEFFDDPFFIPRNLNDLLRIGAIPNLPIYRENLPEEINIDGVFISHPHTDHFRYISTLNRAIPVYLGEASSIIVSSFAQMKRSRFEDDFSGIDFRTFKNSQKIKINGLEIEPIECDHSVIGAYGFIIHTSEGPIAYTGDFRMHGPRANLTYEFINKLEENKVKVIICEGTNLVDFHPITEQEVALKIDEIIKNTKKLVLIDTSFVDIDRIKAIYEVAKKNNRKLVLSEKQAFYLYNLRGSSKLQIPDIVKDESIFMYVKQKERYDRWEQYLQFVLENKIVRNEEIQANPEKYVFVGSFYSLRELTEIEPPPASIYILSTSEPFNEEREMSYEKLINWLDYYGIPMYHTHASGHIGPLQLQEMMEKIKPEKVFSVHTSYPNLFLKFVSKFVKEVVLPQKGIEYKVIL
jgi:ribonuclease J